MLEYCSRCHFKLFSSNIIQMQIFLFSKCHLLFTIYTSTYLSRLQLLFPWVAFPQSLSVNTNTLLQHKQKSNSCTEKRTITIYSYHLHFAILEMTGKILKFPYFRQPTKFYSNIAFFTKWQVLFQYYYLTNVICF